MTTIAFDTHKFLRTIKESGVPENQAEAIAEAFRAAQVEADPVTRTDLAAHGTDLRHALQETEQRLKEQIDLLRSDLTGKFTLLQWMLGLLLAGVASIIIKSFFQLSE
ncbi:DUF1640 domain-containing protein [Candidatus Thiodictyon syntrophicum]|jgi:hypothetical protein|uniref:DUF1640 domain-containing protein n=1 Tax=Candidatus Thiodictyon syntrophicum TaxID=1166950 RepID=A0A2K8U9F0_9GAMM|nr:DUF1640 domain-containing protein [Candidatus Thiodictyon syntrophicum]AUB82210.1 hypothetical protein THSYN_15480 [Candidatus Thiodictyon syntrophicum]